MEGRGRLMGDVLIDDGSLGQILLDHGMAKPCSGKRPEWSQEELDSCLKAAIEFAEKSALVLASEEVIIDDWQ